VAEGKVGALVISVIAGKAGVGKTTLAVHAAYRASAGFPDGQLYANLHDARGGRIDPAQILAGFLRSLGITGAAIPRSLEERAALFRNRLAGRRTLIVLDNAADEAQIRPLLPGSPGCAVVVTSRQRLAGLAAAHFFTLQVMDMDSAVELLAKVAGPDRVAAELPQARRIASTCGFLPLAIRIAGARLAKRGDWRLATLADRLRDEHGRLRLTELKAGDLEVRAPLRLHYFELGEAERWAFRLLGLVRTTHFAGWVVAALMDADLAAAERLVEGLVDQNLLDVAGTDQAGQTRYQLHDLLRVFAAEQLEREHAAADRDAARRRMLAGYLTLAEQANARLEPFMRPFTGGTAPRWPLRPASAAATLVADPLAWFGAERWNFLPVVEQAYDAELWELTWELARALSTYFELRSVWSDWQRTHQLALQATWMAGNRHGEAIMWRSLGDAYRAQTLWNDAITCYEMCLPIFRALKDRRGEARTRRHLGIVYLRLGRLDEAIWCFEWAYDAFSQLDDRVGVARTLHWLGVALRLRGRYDRAIACFNRCLPALEQLGDRLEEAHALCHLSDVHRNQYRFAEALEPSRRALDIFRQLEDEHGAASAQRSIGITLREQGRLDEAIALFEGCLEVFRKLSDRHGEAHVLRHLGSALRLRGDLQQAGSCLVKCLAVFEELGDRPGAAAARLDLGQLAHDRGQLGTAMAHYRRCLAMFRRIGDPLREAKTLAAMARIQDRQGRALDAAAAGQAARKIFADLGLAAARLGAEPA